uniref:LanC-like protein 3 homolog n=1 Tax=Glossina morsitans morsitans TaxID=37546 RepID=A0A1B0G9X1_GLOMM
MLLRLAVTLFNRLVSASISTKLENSLLTDRLVKPQNTNVFARNYMRGLGISSLTLRTESKVMQCLKESLKAPPSESTFSMGEAAGARQADIGLGALCYCDLHLTRQVRMQDNALLRYQVFTDRLHNICGYFGASCVAVCRTPGLLKFTSKIDHTRLCSTNATKTPNSNLQLLAKEEKKKRYFTNPFPDYVDPRSTPYEFDEKHVKHLIAVYVDGVLEKCSPGYDDEEMRGDLYIGNAGIAYMFWKMSRSPQTQALYPALKHAHDFICNAKANTHRYKKPSAEPFSFLYGNAGIYAVSAAVSHDLKLMQELSDDLVNFKAGITSSKALSRTQYGWDEMLLGRAGYLAGCYWLNDIMPRKEVTDDDLISICQLIIANGREYAEQFKAPLPLMYQWRGREYLGAAHGLCAILHMLLESPWFRTDPISAPSADLRDIKKSIDYFLALQDDEGNFPVALENLGRDRDTRLVHWCHGAPGAVYLLAKAYLIFKEDKYMQALRRSSDLVWNKGFLRKGPGICHGVAGNGYVFLLLYRLTHEPKYLYRAVKYMELLTNAEFQQRARIPNCPHSLFEGVAGTVCFLIDLLNPKQAQFPFMDVFH